jgi:chromate reductase, NAD(P)H dehydrogenase (quinone)
MSKKNILVFAGSARKDSFNKKLAAIAAAETRAAGAEVTLVDLADYVAPVYHGDLEEADGLPQTMRDFKALVRSHDALFIVTPEYNGFVPPLLVNTLAWVSRPEGDEDACIAFAGKTAALAATSPGGLGGVRVIPRLRDCLAELGVVTIPGFVTVPKAFEAFGDDGMLIDSSAQAMVRNHARNLVSSVA